MKILFLALDVNIKARAGDAVHVRELTMALAKLGHEVVLIAPFIEDGPKELAALKDHQNVKIFFAKTGRYFKNISTISFCKKVAKKGGAEIIYERRFSAKIGYSLGKLLKIPYFVEINGLPGLELKMLGKMRKQRPLVGAIKKRIRRRFFMHASKIVAVTNGIKEALIADYNLPPDNIVVVPNGANVDLFKKMDKLQCRQQLGLNRNDKYVCFSGNLAPWQGLDILIKSAPIVIKKIPDATFIIVGDGMMRDRLVSLVDKLNLRNSFIFTDWVPYKDTPRYINSSDICVAPFIRERNEMIGLSPLKIYEYLSCEKPVVASFVKGLEFLEEENLGLLVPPNNLAELGDALLKLLMNEEIAMEMGANGRRYVVENHSWRGVALRIAEICEQAN